MKFLNYLALCALSILCLINPNFAFAQVYDPADMAISQAASLKALKLVENLTASLAVNSPAQSNVSSCERKLQETVTCTSSGCDQRPAIDYCGRALARAASVDRDPRIGQVLSAFRSFKADLADIKATVHTIDDTTGRIESGVDSNSRKLDDIARSLDEVKATIVKAQSRGICNDEVSEIVKLHPAAQVIALQKLKTCVDQRPNLTLLGTSAIENGVGFIGTGDMIIVDPTQNDGGSSGWKKVAIIGGSTVGGALLGAGIGAWAYPAVTDAGRGFQKDSAALKGAAIVGGTTLLTSLLVTALTD